MKTLLFKFFLAGSLIVLSLNNAKAITVTLAAASTTGLASSGQFTYNQTAVGVLGFNLTTNGTTTFSSFQFSATQPIATYFTNFKLYVNTANSFSGSTLVSGTSYSFPTTTTLTISGLSQAVNNTSKYYFVVADYTVASSTAVSFTLSTTGVTGTTSGAGTVNSTLYTLSATVCDWVGTTNTTWGTASNWKNGKIPGPYDAVLIAVNYSPTNNIPVLNTSGTTTIASLNFGGNFSSGGGINWPGLTVSSGCALSITGDITINVDASPGVYGTIPTNEYLISGTGSINAVNMNIYANYGALSTNDTQVQQAVYCSVNSLVLSGNLGLTSQLYNPGSSYFQYATFYLTAGITEVDGAIQTKNIGAITSTVQINPSSSAGATLALKGVMPLSGLSTSGTNAIGVNNTYATVNYSGTTQTIYTSSGISGLSGGLTYYNLTLSGGTQTPSAGTLTVANDFTTTSTAAQFNTNNTVLAVSDISYIRGGTMTLGSGTLITNNGFDVYGSAIFNAGSGNIIDGNFFRVNIDLGSSTVNLGTGTTTIGNAVQLFGGTVNCGTGPISVVSSTQIFTGATLNAGIAGTALLTLTGSYQNFLGGTFTAGGGSVYYNNNYANSGTFTAGAGTVYFNFAGAQALSDASVAGTTFNKVNFQNSGTKTMSGTGGFAVSGSGVLTMAGTATLAAGGVLTLRSISLGTATVAAIPSTCLITGTVKVERYITGGTGYRGYRLLSSPVNAGTDGSGNKVYSIDYIVNSTYVSGTGFSVTATSKVGNPCFYLYREDRAPLYSSFLNSNNRGIKSITNSTTYVIDIDGGPFNIPIGNGLLYFFRGGTATTSPYTSSSTPVTATVTASGTLNQGSIQVVDWYTPGSANLGFTTVIGVPATPSGNSAVKGFNIVGNPYASPIDWNGYYNATPALITIINTNIDPTIWQLKPGTNQYGTYNGFTKVPSLNGGSNIIASGQGFFIKTNNTGAILKFTESAKSLTQPSVTLPFLASGYIANTAYSHYMILNIAKDTTSKSEILVGFNATSNKKYNHIEDDLYLSGPRSPQVMYITSADNFKVVSKWLPLPKAKQADTAHLSVKALKSGRYTITRSELKDIPSLYNIWLMDKYKKDSLDIKHNDKYIFDINLSDTNSYGAHRFQVIIRQDPALGVHLLNFAAAKTTNGANVTWKTENEEDYTQFTVERSTDNGKTFVELGGIASNFQQTYNFTDKNPAITADHYRLKLVDLSGEVTYSKIVTLMYSTLSNNIANNAISIYPNPTRGNINVSITPNALSLANASDYSFNIIITGSNGTIVKKAISSQLEWQNNVTNLLPGSYVVHIINNKDKTVVGKTKFVKL